VRLNPYRWRKVVLLTAGPLAYWGLALVPFSAKFRTIAGGYEARRWFKLAVIVSGSYEMTRKPPADLKHMSAATRVTTQDDNPLPPGV